MSCHRFGLRPAFLFERLRCADPKRFQAVLTLPALGGSVVNIGAFAIVVYDLLFVQQAHAVTAENKDRL